MFLFIDSYTIQQEEEKANTHKHTYYPLCQIIDEITTKHPYVYMTCPCGKLIKVPVTEA